MNNLQAFLNQQDSIQQRSIQYSSIMFLDKRKFFMLVTTLITTLFCNALSPVPSVSAAPLVLTQQQDGDDSGVTADGSLDLSAYLTTTIPITIEDEDITEEGVTVSADVPLQIEGVETTQLLTVTGELSETASDVSDASDEIVDETVEATISVIDGEGEPDSVLDILSNLTGNLITASPATESEDVADEITETVKEPEAKPVAKPAIEAEPTTEAKPVKEAGPDVSAEAEDTSEQATEVVAEPIAQAKADADAPAQATAQTAPQATSTTTSRGGPIVSIRANPRLNVRRGPGSNYAVIGKLASGTEVQVLGADETGTWYQVSLAGIPDSGNAAVGNVIEGLTKGWVSANFTQAVSNVGQEVVARATSEEEQLEAEAVTADEESSISDIANADTTSIEDESAESASASPAPTVPTAFIQPERMNVRGGPGTSYEVVTVATAGTGLEILALSPGGDWYQVRIEGQEGQSWVYAPLTRVAGPMEEVQTLREDEIPALPEAPEPVEETAQAEAAQAEAVISGQSAPAPVAIVDAPPPSGGGFFGYGVQAHMLGGGAGKALESTQTLGFNWIKQQVEWKLFHAGSGELHGIVGGAESRGINVLFSVVNAPEWARESGFDGSVGGPPADPQTYAEFVGRLAGEFCGSGLKAIEVWNEQNLHYEWGNKALDPVEYMNLLRPAYASIKAACPSMLVISGALTPAGSNPPFAVDDFAYLEGMYQNGLANYSDGIGAHPSGFNVPPSHTWETACEAIQQSGNSFNGACDNPHHSWSFRSTMEGYRNIMVQYGDADKRIWPTEFGWAAGGAFDGRYAYANDNSFDEQANWTVEAYTMMRNWGWVGPAFLWNLNFRVVADGTEKAQWGIVNNQWQPLPIYNSLQAMPK